MYGAMLLFGAGWPAFGNPCGIRSCGMLFRFEPRLASSSLKSPLRIAAENVRENRDPESICCRCASNAAKKKSLSRFFV